MTPSVPTIDTAPFGTYIAYLAALLGGLKTALGLCQFEVYGKNAKLVEEDGDGDDSVEIGPIGNVVAPDDGALPETPVEL